MKRLIVAVIVVLLLTGRVHAQTTPYPINPILQPPTSGLVITYTVGQIVSGGMVAQIPAGSVTVSDGMTNCAAPAFASCNFIYWPGSGTTLAVTTSPGTAFAAGNVILGYVNTSGGNVTTIVFATPSKVPVGVSTSPSSTASSTSTFRFPLCNALLQQGCQAAVRQSLSGY